MTDGGPAEPGAQLSATDLAVDHRLSLLAQSFRFLLDITPVDADDRFHEKSFREQVERQLAAALRQDLADHAQAQYIDLDRADTIAVHDLLPETTA